MFAAPLWVALVLKVGPAAAEEAESQQPIDDAAVAYRAALDLHAAGDLEGALARMMESYRLSQRDELLYNIARIQWELGDCLAALTDYRRYVERVPTGRFRDLADAAVRELEPTCKATKPAAVESPTPTVATNRVPAPSRHEPSPTPRPRPRKREASEPRMLPWVGWSAVAAGGLAGLGAVYCTVKAVHARDEYRASVEAEENGGRHYDPSLEAKQHTNQRWAQALGVAGGALATGGVLWLLLAPRERGQSSPNTAFSLAPGFFAASWRQSF